MKYDQTSEDNNTLNLFRLEVNNSSKLPKFDLEAEIYRKDDYSVYHLKDKDIDDQLYFEK